MWTKKVLRAPGAALALWRDRQKTFRYRLAVGAIFKDEARFLGEWLAFHHAVGVEHFYLYNNGSSDNFRDVLAQWIAKDLVTLVQWPGVAVQIQAYNDCIRRFRSQARRIAFIDIDEFLFSPKDRDLRTVLAAYDDLPAVFVYWHMFGSSGHVKRPPGPVVESYTRRLDHPLAHRNGKAIVNPRLVREMDVHWAKTWVGATRDENRRPPPHGPDQAGAVASHAVFRINHYWSKSIEDLHDKVRRGDGAFPVERDLARHLETEKMLNDVEDQTILPLWQEIKAAGDPEAKSPGIASRDSAPGLVSRPGMERE